MSWVGDRPVALDLYYDPVIDHHHAHGPGALALPAWYLAPQRREVAEAGWALTAKGSGALGDGPLTGLDDPLSAVSLLQLAGEFADPALCERLWEAADAVLEPTWDETRGEFSFGFGLAEPHPRGQLNARAAAARACSEGAWFRVFNEPNLAKFEQPTIVGVDFPAVALSEASWDAERGELNVTATPRNEKLRGQRTRFRVTNVSDPTNWAMTPRGGEPTPLAAEGGDVAVETTVDGRSLVIARRSYPGRPTSGGGSSGR